MVFYSGLEELLDAQVNSGNTAKDAKLEGLRHSEGKLALSDRFDINQLASLLCLGQSWVWETDSEHRFSFISSAMETATGLLVKDSLGKTRRECFFGAGDLSEAMLAHLDDLNNHRPFSDFVFRSSGKTHPKLWVSISGTPRFDENGIFAGYIGISRGLSNQAFMESGLKNAADQLSRVEKLMQEVFESVPVAIALYDRDNSFIACNRNYREMYHIIADTLNPGTGILEILEAAFDRGMVSVAPFSEGETRAETRQKWLDERLRQYAVGIYADITRLANGRSLKQFSKRLEDGTFISVRVDVTDQIERDEMIAEASTKTQQSRERLHNAVEGLSTGFGLWSADDKLVMCNARFRELLSDDVPFFEDESYGTIIRRIMAHNQISNFGDDAEQWLIKDIRNMAEQNEIEDVYVLPDNRWVLRRVTRSPNGEKIDIRTDITELKNKERSLTTALEDAVLAQNVINSLTEPVFVKDSNLNFVFCNDAFAAILNAKASDFPGKRAGDFVSQSEAAAFEESERQVLDGNGIFELEEDHFEGGMQKSRILRKVKLTTGSGKNYLAAYMFDVTAQRQREHALAAASRRAESADKAKSDFLAQMSHEIKTPMNGVLSMSELLLQSQLDERQQVFVDIIRKSGETLLATINSILDFTQIESGSIALESKSFPLRTAVEDVAEMMAVRAIEKETDILINIAPDLPATLVGDEGRLRQIISNLLSNAIKFTENGQIIISVTGQSVKPGKLNLTLTVADNGIGIPTDKLSQVFDRFSQISAPNSTKPDGTGLGLSIVAKLVKTMGGVCRVQSELGKGSKFFVDLSMDCTDLRAPSKPISDALRAKRILIIDANPEWRTSLLTPLKHWGFDVAAVENAKMAIDLAHVLFQKGLGVDLVLIGCNFPKQSCIEIGHSLDLGWPGKKVTKLLLAPMNAALNGQAMAKLNAHSMISLPVKQAALYHHVVAALQAKADFEPDAAETIVREEDVRPAQEETQNTTRVDVLIAEDNPVNQLVITQILSGTGLAYQIVNDGERAVAAYKD
ncbi:MAG: ATP-binding protein, partial [Notoacmeibacter sp.]